MKHKNIDSVPGLSCSTCRVRMANTDTSAASSRKCTSFRSIFKISESSHSSMKTKNSSHFRSGLAINDSDEISQSVRCCEPLRDVLCTSPFEEMNSTTDRNLALASLDTVACGLSVRERRIREKVIASKEQLPWVNYTLVYWDAEFFECEGQLKTDLSQIGAYASDGATMVGYVLPKPNILPNLLNPEAYILIEGKCYFRSPDNQTLHLTQGIHQVLCNFIKFIGEKLADSQGDSVVLLSMSNESTLYLLKSLFRYHLWNKFKCCVGGVGDLQSLAEMRTSFFSGYSVQNLSLFYSKLMDRSPPLLFSCSQRAMILEKMTLKLLNGEYPNYFNLFKSYMTPVWSKDIINSVSSQTIDERINSFQPLISHVSSYSKKGSKIPTNAIYDFCRILAEDDIDFKVMQSTFSEGGPHKLEVSTWEIIHKRLSTFPSSMEVCDELIDATLDFFAGSSDSKKDDKPLEGTVPQEEPTRCNVAKQSKPLYLDWIDYRSSVENTCAKNKQVALIKDAACKLLVSSMLTDEGLSYIHYRLTHEVKDVKEIRLKFEEYIIEATRNAFTDDVASFLSLETFVHVTVLHYCEKKDPFLTRATYKAFKRALPTLTKASKAVSPPLNQYRDFCAYFAAYVSSRMSKGLRGERGSYAHELSLCVSRILFTFGFHTDSIPSIGKEGVFKKIYLMFRKYQIPGLLPYHVAASVTAFCFR